MTSPAATAEASWAPARTSAEQFIRTTSPRRRSSGCSYGLLRGIASNIVGKAWDRIGTGAYKGPGGKEEWTVLFAGSVRLIGRAPSPSLPPRSPSPRPGPKPCGDHFQAETDPTSNSARDWGACPARQRLALETASWRDRRDPPSPSPSGDPAIAGQSLRRRPPTHRRPARIHQVGGLRGAILLGNRCRPSSERRNLTKSNRFGAKTTASWPFGACL